MHYGKMGLSYIFRHDDINIYENGRRGYNFTYNQHSLDFQVASFNIRNFSCDINLCMDFYDFHNTAYIVVIYRIKHHILLIGLYTRIIKGERNEA